MGTKIIVCILTFLVFNTSDLYAQYSKSEWKERDGWMNVSQILDDAQVTDGSIVGDVGCHEGYLSFHLSKRVGGTGKVYSVDVREDRLEKLRENVRSNNVLNIEVIFGDYDDPKLPSAKLDAVFVIDTYHEIDDYKSVLAHIKNSLKLGGRLLILEKLKEHAKEKSRKDQMDAHTLSMKYVKKDIEKAGFSVIKEVHDFGKWENDTDKTMWILVATKTID